MGAGAAAGASAYLLSADRRNGLRERIAGLAGRDQKPETQENAPVGEHNGHQVEAGVS